MTGIISYGVYLPSFAIKVSAIAQSWRKNGAQISQALKIKEKRVADRDEDTATLAWQAASLALKNIKLSPSSIEAVYIGSESHPYTVKPTATIVGNFLGLTPNYMAADLEFACKAGTAALQICHSLVESRQCSYTLAIGSDTAQGKPSDALEYSAASGAAAFILGNNKVLAEIIATTSYSSDTPDFWRAPQNKYPDHGGRFTGEPAYYKHVIQATKAILKKTGLSINDINQVVFHMPNGVFPRRAAKRLGVNTKQLATGLVVEEIGNTYSANSLIGLTAVLDKAHPNDKILVTSYGSGAGADSFILQVTNNITTFQNQTPLEKYLANKTYLDYSQYLIMRQKITI